VTPARRIDRWAAWPFIGLLRAYRLLISPLYGNTCRFYPSCSAYSLESLRRHGLVRGTWLTVWRLLRCNPWNAGGVDLVPAMRAVPAVQGVSVTDDTAPQVERECHHDGGPVVRSAA
jgi:putative membrane protein insertion efficiency factor